MIPRRQDGTGGFDGIPRESGDDPPGALQVVALGEYSPRERG